MRFYSRSMLFLLSASSCAFMAMLPTAHAEDTSTFTKLELSASGTTDAAPDQLTAIFRAEARNKNAATAQQAVNALVQKITEQTGKNDAVQLAVTRYDVSETRPDKEPAFWTATQRLSLKAQNGNALLPLAGQLQANGLILESLDWSISDDKRESLLLDAEKNAVAELKKQADTVAASLGLHVVRFSNVAISENPIIRPMPMMMSMARSADAPAAAPSSTAQTQHVRANAHATILLGP